MSKKHFEEYLESVRKSYVRMENVYKAYQEECEKNMTPPEVLQQIEETMRPVKDSYNSLIYVKYLLDKPNRESKGARYMKQNKKLLQNLDRKYTKEGVLEKNAELLKQAEDQANGGDK